MINLNLEVPKMSCSKKSNLSWDSNKRAYEVAEKRHSYNTIGDVAYLWPNL